MSEGYRAWFNTALGERAFMAKQLAGAGASTYVAQDDLGGRSLWGGEPLAKWIHYSTDVNGRRYFISVGLTADGKAAAFDFHAQ